MGFEANEVDSGHIVKCAKCKKATYWPFDRPWHRNRKLVAGYAISLVVALLLGIAGNAIYDKIKSSTGEAENVGQSQETGS